MRALLPLAGSLIFAIFARADEGGALFGAHGCASCHRLGSRGGDAGPDLTLVGVRRPRAWLEKWLGSPRDWKPDTLMPQQGLSDADRAALSAFLAEQKGEAWGRAKPWDALSGWEKGRTIYARAGCVACHGPGGRGGHPNPGARGGVIPALAPLMGTYRAEELKAKIERGVAAGEGAVAMPGWKGVLTDGDLDALTEYLLSLAESSSKSDW